MSLGRRFYFLIKTMQDVKPELQTNIVHVYCFHAFQMDNMFVLVLLKKKLFYSFRILGLQQAAIGISDTHALPGMLLMSLILQGLK